MISSVKSTEAEGEQSNTISLHFVHTCFHLNRAGRPLVNAASYFSSRGQLDFENGCSSGRRSSIDISKVADLFVRQ